MFHITGAMVREMEARQRAREMISLMRRVKQLPAMLRCWRELGYTTNEIREEGYVPRPNGPEAA